LTQEDWNQLDILEIVEFCLLLIAAYLIGSIPMAYLVVKKLYREDLRRFGSGQVGGSNVYRSFSKRWGIFVGVFDLFKGLILVWAARILGLGIEIQIAIGLAVVIGHNWPVFLLFNGGRGLAATAGVCLFLLPWGIIPFVFFALFTFLVGGSPLPLLISVASLPITSWALQYFGRPQPLVLTLGLILFLIIMVIRRVTSPKTAASATISRRELFLNRLLLDRDIKDIKSWIGRKPKDKDSFK
jgi:glycerol-3-phosphate acyltransferase PlsY